MAKVKKIYEWRKKLIDYCRWCEGQGWTGYLGKCLMCKGTGGLKYRRVKVLVREEVIE